MKKILSICVATLLAIPLLAQTEVFNLENPAVQAFMADRTYDTNSDYSVTVIEKYNTDEYYSDRDRPLPVVVKWDARPEGSVWVRVQVSEKADFTRIVHTEEQRAVKRTQQIYNLIPGRTYYYRVQYNTEDGGEYTTFLESQFQTAGQVRMLRIDGMSNVRDLGGWATSFGKPLNYGIIFRNARTDEVTLAGAAAYKALGMAAELDLRDDSELTSSPLGEEIDYIRLASTAQYSTGVKNDWQPFVNDFNWIISRLRKGKVLNFHCTAGADRTGTLAWLLEGLLGVGEADLSRDFELTTLDGTWGSRPRNYDPGKGNLSDMLAYVRTFGNSADLAGCFYNYWINRGAKAEDIAFFRHLMLDEYVPVETIVTGDAVISLAAGDSHQLTARVSPSNATYTDLSFTSSDASVITVDENGFITAVGEGNAFVEIRSIKGEASSIVRVHVAGAPETNYPDEVVVADGTMLKLYTTGRKNLISNGSFEYNNCYFGWHSGASDNINAENFEIVTTDAPDGKNYLRALKGDVSASAASIFDSWRIESDKNYVFGFKVKNEKGQAVNANANLLTTLVALDSEADGTGSDLGWGDDDEDDVEAKRKAVAVDDVFTAPSYDGQWTDVQYIFNSGKNLYLKIDFSQLVDANQQLCFDGFYLVEVTESGTVNPEEYLSFKMIDVWLTNCGTEAFQHPLACAEAVRLAKEKAQQALNNGSVEDIAAAATSLNIAVKVFNEAELNRPADGDSFNILQADKVAFYQNGVITFVEEKKGQRPLPLTFTHTGEKDTYVLSFVTDTHKTMFIAFADGEMVAVENGADAQTVKVQAYAEVDCYGFLDESAKEVMSWISIRKVEHDDTVDGSGSDLGWGDDDDDDDEDTGINGVGVGQSIADAYSVSGQKLSGHQKGIVIIRTKDGKVMKVVK